MAAGIIEHVGEFNGMSDDWVVYSERLEQYFFANKIEEAKVKVATLISLIGDPTYKLLRDLCHPSLPKDKNYEELSDLLKKQFSPQVSKWRERIKFYEAKQKLSETISEWYARIKNLAVNCEFGTSLETILKDRLVSGLQKGRVLDRLCEEDTEKTLKQMVELAMKKESGFKEEEVNHISKIPAQHQRVWQQGRRSAWQRRTNQRPPRQMQITHRRTVTQSQHRNQQRSEKENDSRGYVSQNNGKNCVHCANKHPGLCKYENFVCNKCKKKGHLARACRNSGQFTNFF
ncbi:hypothetical protein NQ314_013665 [Rhamnusium bicolor]|uniref:CCHC-type domain-containing protein n=1 Tax=Rhamnusium bicolor TaxID=1586634 RepID=A0AAV8X5I9_9CUCU|nr:hypothetical protein NQ314_013665 [Rhamnusium bicolor]